jgi:hypothetical protein
MAKKSFFKKIADRWNSTTPRIIRFVQGFLTSASLAGTFGYTIPANQLPPALVSILPYMMACGVLAVFLGFTKTKEDSNQLPPK